MASLWVCKPSHLEAGWDQREVARTCQLFFISACCICLFQEREAFPRGAWASPNETWSTRPGGTGHKMGSKILLVAWDLRKALTYAFHILADQKALSKEKGELFIVKKGNWEVT